MGEGIHGEHDAPLDAAIDRAAQDDAVHLAPGAIVGEYEIVALLGRGASGHVYRVRHRSLHRHFAMKVVVVSSGERAVRPGRRLVREARTTSSLRHENIVDVTDLGHTDAGLVFVVMELLDGEDLSKRLARADDPIGDDEARSIAEGMLLGVEAAHRAGVVHRDLKPANVFLARRGDRTVATLLDFGLSRVIGAEHSVRLTHSGQLVGTPLYMAPEQSRGEEVDARSDVYSLGVLLYELFSGSVPFPASSVYECVLSHATRPPPPLSLRRPDLPRSVVSTIERCLEKSPDDRFADASALRAAWSQAWSQGWTARPATRSSFGRSTLPAILGACALVVAASAGAWSLKSAFVTSTGTSPIEPTERIASPPPAPRLVSTAPPPLEEARPDAGMALVTLRTIPPGAAVYDGTVRLGETPLAVRADARALSLRHPGYRSRRVELDPAERERTLRLQPILAPR